MKRLPPIGFWLLMAAILLLAATILTDALPLLRGPAPETPEWYWPYRLRPAARWGPALLAGGALLWLSAFWLGRSWGRRAAIAILIGWACLHLVLQLAIMAADPDGWQPEPINRTLAILNNGYFQPAVAHPDLDALLRRYPAAMPAFESEHARTHPPGLIVQNWLLIRFFEHLPSLAAPLAAAVWPQRCTDLWLLDQPAPVAAALAVSAYLPLLAAALAVLPAYGTARRLLPPAAARLAALLVGPMPALVLFAPNSDQVFATIGLVALYTTLRGLETPGVAGRSWLAASGLLLGLLTFLSLGTAALLLPLAGLIGLIRLFGSHSDPQTVWPQLTVDLAVLAAGASLPWLLFWIGWGVPPWSIAAVGLGQHYELVTLQRNYRWWVGWNLVDLVVFLGLPAAAGFLAALPGALRRVGRPLAALTLSTLFLIVLLDLSGSARGEVGRLWLFFMPLLVIPAAGALHSRWPGTGRTLLLAAGQLLLTLALGFAWVPVEDPIVVAQRPEMPPVPGALVPVAVDFGRNLHLAGYALVESDAALDLTLVWEARGPALRPYTVFNHLVGPEGTLAAQHDGWPVDNRWPPTCWRAGDRIIDRHVIELGDGLPAGTYKLLTGFYDARDLTRLPAADGRTEIELVQITLR